MLLLTTEISFGKSVSSNPAFTSTSIVPAIATDESVLFNAKIEPTNAFMSI